MYADTVLMIRPAAFAFNAETAATNFFQQAPEINQEELQQEALQQFDNMVILLRQQGVRVIVIEDTIEPAKPDAIFPNNWISTDARGRITVFPMQSESRRKEKRKDIIDALRKNFDVRDVTDLSHFEEHQEYLEGTGSLVIDHFSKTVYAGLSPRTSENPVHQFALANGLRPVLFETADQNKKAIYHTNVLMCVSEKFAVICADAIKNKAQKEAVITSLQRDGRRLIEITIQQMNCFAGNMLALKNSRRETVIVMSTTAQESLRPDQLVQLECVGTLLPVPVPVIEEVEGGSVRCMMAEIFLQPNGSV